ncbi:MAG: molybdenum cofactor guanylyltransferase [Verrucomicrobia bacterium]|nr:molybdenum cofactor guanylyltransferase [Verrucomicrobiota bacterium]
MKFSAVILAGGQSRRMGRDKAWIEYDGQPMIQWTLNQVRQTGITEVFISGQPDVDYAALGCPLLLDPQPHLGPLSGIERGLHRCTLPLLLVLAVDMPGITTDWLQKLVARCDALTGVVPQWQGRLEPLAAVYPKRCHCFAFDRILRGSRAAREFATDCLREGAVKRWKVPASAASGLANWNWPHDVDLSAAEIRKPPPDALG